MDLATITSFVLSLRLSDGEGISPDRMADVLGMPLAELAHGANVPLAIAATDPSFAPLQAHLHDLVPAIAAAAIVTGDIAKAAFWLGNEPIPTFHDQTGYQLVCAGRKDDLVAYLESVEAGYVG